MRVISQSVRVNDPAGEGGAAALTRAEVWATLLSKAENALPFVAGMTECTVLERTEGGLVREVVLNGGERVREEVVFHPQHRVSFHRDDETARWVIHNDIEEDADGELLLSFTGELDLGGAEEQDGAAERMRAGYALALRTTLERARAARGAARA
ncbi:SRPBCC family protein [Kitasatospora sp. NPDC051853]|uniref:SRPBCC family protein n=1 Tax=Kitasatospora sp. NPDC051853 TaxID=3364058 RepID=UPI0037A1F96E